MLPTSLVDGLGACCGLPYTYMQPCHLNSAAVQHESSSSIAFKGRTYLELQTVPNIIFHIPLILGIKAIHSGTSEV